MRAYKSRPLRELSWNGRDYSTKLRGMVMKKQAPKPKNWIRYYDDRNILDEITDESVDLILDEQLRDEILSGKRKRKLKNVTIKMDPLQVKAIKKLWRYSSFYFNKRI